MPFILFIFLKIICFIFFIFILYFYNLFYFNSQTKVSVCFSYNLQKNLILFLFIIIINEFNAFTETVPLHCYPVILPRFSLPSPPPILLAFVFISDFSSKWDIKHLTPAHMILFLCYYFFQRFNKALKKALSYYEYTSSS